MQNKVVGKVGSKKIVDRKELQTLDMGLQKFLEIIVRMRHWALIKSIVYSEGFKKYFSNLNPPFITDLYVKS